MDRMGVEYQRFDGKEYVSLRRYYNLLCKCKALEKENKKLREFKEKREESMFYFKAQMERAEPKTAREAEDLQKAKELFEGIYRGELYYLEQENKQLKETNMDLKAEDLQKFKKLFEKLYREEIHYLQEENKNLKERLEKWEKDYKEGIIVHCRNG